MFHIAEKVEFRQDGVFSLKLLRIKIGSGMNTRLRSVITVHLI